MKESIPATDSCMKVLADEAKTPNGTLVRLNLTDFLRGVAIYDVQRLLTERIRCLNNFSGLCNRRSCMSDYISGEFITPNIRLLLICKNVMISFVAER